jgi:YHS domain-containing protein
MDSHPYRMYRAATGASAILVLMGWALVPTVAAGDEPESISWRTDYSRALEEAQSRKQLLWIQFTAPWCPNCTRMEQDSFSHPAIRGHARRSFVPVKLRADANEELALHFELSGLPATVIVSPSREVLAVRQGYLGPNALDLLLAGSLSRHGTATLLASTKDGEQAVPCPKVDQDGAAPAKARTKTETEVALSGFCPVSLVSDKRLVQGQSEYTVTHEGRLYRFASLVTFNLFRGDPERYVPVNQGNCPVSQLDRKTAQPGDPRYGVLFQNRLFLCATDADRRRFLEQPARYAAIDVAEQGFCPHCLSQSGVLVRGDPRIELSREGRRYWFPDSTHREAFLASSANSSTTRR